MLTFMFLTAQASTPDLSGRWVPVQTPAEIERIHQEATEKALDTLNWALRPLARGPLEKSVESCVDLTLALSDEGFEAHCVGKPPFTYDAPFEPRIIDGRDGKKVQVKPEVGPDGLTLVFDGERGGMTTTWTRTPQGLSVSKRIHSSHLPTPIAWRVDYRRAAQ